MSRFLPTLALLLLLPFLCWSAPLEETPPLAGQLLIKLKPAFTYMNTDGAGMRASQWKSIAPALSISGSTAFSSFSRNSTAKSAGSKKNSGVDLRLYHQLSFDPDLPLSQAVEQLYKTGMVELAEPVYAATSLFTPDDPNIGSQYYLDLVKAYDAWELSQGSKEVIVAIIDSGVDLQHPDLLNNLYTNTADPLDGVDNEGDGFVDNYWGWDFAGSDYITLRGDNDPHISTDNAGHGTKVAGCASAVPNNGIGIAGIGFNTKLMVLKHTADNDTRFRGRGYLDNLLQGVMYAATHGAQIINASYGSTYYSQIEQDIYRLVTLDYGVLVVAAAGNSGNEIPVYPASYEHVLSVGASNSSDQKASLSSYGYSVDISAPGEGVYSTKVRGGYESSSGTSFSAPMVAGGAALLKSSYPALSGFQIGELLRVSSDTSFSTALDPQYRGKMGLGRMDLKQAFAYNGPSLRLNKVLLKGKDNAIAQAGEEAVLICSFQNFLWKSSDVQVKLISLNAGIEVIGATSTLGQMEMLQLVSNENSPFRIRISEEVPENTEVMFRLEYSGKGYKDFQYVKVMVNQNFLDIRENRISTTFLSDGRIGYGDANRKSGKGFCLDERNLLYEMGLIIATAENKVLSNIRGAHYGADDDFRATSRINKTDPGRVADVEVFGSFNGAGDTLTKLNLEVDYHLYIMRDAPYDGAVVLQYTVKNRGEEPLTELYMGLFSDWDITPNSAKDKAAWDSVTSTGYIYAPNHELQKVGAIQVLTGNPHYWAIDNLNTDPHTPVNVGDGFTDQEKYKALSSGIGRAEAGMASPDGADVSHTVSSGPYHIASGDSVVLAFALHAGTSIQQVLAAAKRVKELYEQEIIYVEKEISTEAFPRAFPNPSKGAVTLNLPDKSSHPYAVKVMDTMGKVISQTLYPAGLQQLLIDIPPARGLYLLEISGKEHRSLQRIIVK